MDQRETKKSLQAGLIGLVLVGVVFLATIFRGAFLRKIKPETKDVSEEVSSYEKDKNEDSLAISPSDLLERISKKEIVVIDVRPQDPFLSEHIIDSKNIPAEKLAGNPSLLDKSKKYVLVDDGNDLTAQKLAETISQQNGFSGEISYLSGGFLSWKSGKSPTISFGDPLSITDQAKVTYVTSEKLKEIIEREKPESLLILDVRKPEDFSQGHLKNSVNIFLEDLEKQRKKIPLGKKVIITDNDGFWAYMAAVRLFDMGIKNTLTLSDGLQAWKEKGFEVVQ